MKNLIALRKSKGLKQSDIAKIVGVSVAAYGFYETGRRQANYETLTMLADYFNTSVDYLLGRTELNTPPAQWTEEEKALGVGAHGTKLSEEEWDWLDLRSEIINAKGEKELSAIIALIRGLIKK